MLNLCFCKVSELLGAVFHLKISISPMVYSHSPRKLYDDILRFLFLNFFIREAICYLLSIPFYLTVILNLNGHFYLVSNVTKYVTHTFNQDPGNLGPLCRWIAHSWKAIHPAAKGHFHKQ